LRKKPRSAKQKANDKRLGRMAQKRAQKPKRRKPRKTTTRKRRTPRKGDLTLKRKKGYSRRKKSSDSDFNF